MGKITHFLKPNHQIKNDFITKEQDHILPKNVSKSKEGQKVNHQQIGKSMYMLNVDQDHKRVITQSCSK